MEIKMGKMIFKKGMDLDYCKNAKEWLIENPKMVWVYLKFYCKQCKCFHVYNSEVSEVKYTLHLINDVFENRKEFGTKKVEITTNRKEVEVYMSNEYKEKCRNKKIIKKGGKNVGDNV